jgi:histidyl-tRNA synthetase
MPRIEKISAPRGMPDTLPAEMPLLRRIEETAHRLFRIYGYEEIRTPLFEETRLFVRGIGEATDIVEKEMYTFADAGRGPGRPADDSITLRPEGTAPVVRAVVEHELLKQQGFWKLYYVGPMFRKERPQAGRLRQFEHIGCEAIGSGEPVVDAESILLAAQFFAEVGLAGVQVKLNTIGCPDCRAVYRLVLLRLLEPRKKELCADCQARLERNVFRVLDCKNPGCKGIAQTLPTIHDHLDPECKKHYAAVKDILERADLKYAEDPHLVRGFDYYTRTVFELWHSALGARDAVCGGGRYDNLVAELGGPQAGCVGFAVGVVPTILALQKQRAPEAPQAAPEAAAGADAYLVAVNDEVRPEIFRLAQRLRAEGIRAEMDYERRSLKAQMRSANKCRARYAIVVGPAELAAGKLKLKDMATGAETVSSFSEALVKVRNVSPVTPTLGPTKRVLDI